MTNKIDDMFGDKPPRQKPKVIAHVIDAGEGALFKCKKCGWKRAGYL